MKAFKCDVCQGFFENKPYEVQKVDVFISEGTTKWNTLWLQECSIDLVFRKGNYVNYGDIEVTDLCKNCFIKSVRSYLDALESNEVK